MALMDTTDFDRDVAVRRNAAANHAQRLLRSPSSNSISGPSNWVIALTYIGRTQPGNPKHGVEYRFRRDPRDVSRIYFFEETTQRYYPIRSALPPLSIWELREVKRLAKERGVEKPDERQMFEILNEMRSIEDEAAAKTRAARSAKQQRAEHAKARIGSGSDLPAEMLEEARSCSRHKRV